MLIHWLLLLIVVAHSLAAAAHSLVADVAVAADVATVGAAVAHSLAE